MNDEVKNQPKSVAEFSLYINKATYDKATQERRWYAVASDIEPDSYKDEMSLELYSDFISRIESNELPPERHRSDFWSGGMPYLSVSHYLDLNGKGVPGPIDEIFVDGKCLKSKGRFYDNELGRKCFDAVCQDLYGENKSETDNKIRISIAFIDWKHKHKSNDYEFVRESLDDICPECLKEMITGEYDGKIFLRGHLIHEALTRVPANERTRMEVERSMTTQKEDAASIVGDELADELSEKAINEIAKADLVIKSDQEDETEPVPEPEEIKAKKEDDEEMDEEDEKKKDKKKDDKEEKSLHVLDVPVKSFLEQYDSVASSDLSYQEKLQALQNAFEQFGETVKSSFSPTPEEVKQEEFAEIKAMFGTLIERQEAMEQKLAILEQKSLTPVVNNNIPQTPVRRSLQQPDFGTDTAPAKPGSLRAIALKSVGLTN